MLPTNIFLDVKTMDNCLIADKYSSVHFECIMVVHLCNVVDTNETLIVLAILYYTQACSLPNIPGLHPVPSKSSGTKRSIPEETEGRNPKKETAKRLQSRPGKGYQMTNSTVWLVKSMGCRLDLIISSKAYANKC